MRCVRGDLYELCEMCVFYVFVLMWERERVRGGVDYVCVLYVVSV